MDRRSFLRTTTAGLGLAACPGWIARAFGGEDGPEGTRAHALAAAAQRAGHAGKPLLILVIPMGDAKRARGEVFGELINHGGREALEDLLLCEIACATVVDVADVFPGAAPKGEPLMLLVEGGAGAPAPVAIDPQITYDIPVRRDQEQETEKAIRRRIEQVSAALHGALLPRADSLAARAGRNRAALSEQDREALAAFVAGERQELEPELVHRGAAVLRHAAARAADEGVRARVRSALAAAADARLRKERPAGARWAQSCGCGVEVEGETDHLMIGCGMGHVPELSRRFLWFYRRS